MKSKLLVMALAGTALAISTPVLAQHGGGHGGGVGGAVGASTGGMGNAGLGGAVGADVSGTHGMNHDTGVSTRTNARLNSQGPTHAADRALDRANHNSVLSSTSGATRLNLKTGLTVRDRTGTTIGTISRINRSADGTIRNVLVKSASGKRKIVTLAPNTLSLNGDVVTTTRLATSVQRH